MAATVTSNLVTASKADATTGWTSSGAAAAFTGFEREATGCLGAVASLGYNDAYFTITATNFSDRTLFAPWMRSGNPHIQADNGYGAVVGDGTNRISYAVGGGDNYGHFVLGWSLFKLDITNRPATFRTLAGAEASLNLASITQIGCSIGYQSKAIGNAQNVFWDVVRHIANGLPALTISGGTSGDPATFADVAADDISTATGKAYGIIRSLVPGSKSYELNFKIEIGSSATASSHFEDGDFQVFIYGPSMKAGNMDVVALANTTGTNVFKLSNFVVVSVGTPSNWDLSSANLNTLEIQGQFVDCGTITFPPAGGTSRKCTNTGFVNCGMVTPNTMPFNNNSFTGARDANGAMLLPATANMSNLAFTSDGTGHAVYITSPGTYAFNSWSFSGYGADGTTDAAVYNNSGGAVTLSISGGSPPTVRNGAGATTTVEASVPITITVKSKATGLGLPDARVNLLLASNKSVILSAAADINGVVTGSYSGATPADVTGWAREMSMTGIDYEPEDITATITATGLPLTIELEPISV